MSLKKKKTLTCRWRYFPLVLCLDLGKIRFEVLECSVFDNIKYNFLCVNIKHGIELFKWNFNLMNFGNKDDMNDQSGISQLNLLMHQYQEYAHFLKCFNFISYIFHRLIFFSSMLCDLLRDLLELGFIPKMRRIFCFHTEMSPKVLPN